MKVILPRNNYFIALFVGFAALASSCKKSSTTTTATTTAPTVVTASSVINLTGTTAQAGGTITGTGDGTITGMGVCYSSTDKTPNINTTKLAVTLSQTATIPEDYIATITGLTPGTTYYLRAYATNSAGTSYGDVVTFTTPTSNTSITANVTTLAGSGSAGMNNGTGPAATFNNPQGLTIDGSGNIIVADAYNSMIRKVTTAGVVTTVAGTGTIGYNDGDALTQATFYGPSAVTTDAQGNIYVADFGNNVIRKITAAGVVSTYIGSGFAGFANGTGNTLVKYNNPSGVALDASGNMYIADYGNNVIRKVTSAGVSSTFAGQTTANYINGTGTGAAFSRPSAVACDAAGNVYVADKGNSAIRKITPAGVVTTIAGGPNQSDLLGSPVALALDKSGNIYIADASGRIIECNTSNVLYILAGTANVSGFADGAGTSALFAAPSGIAVDASGNIYVADQGNNAIRKLVITH